MTRDEIIDRYPLVTLMQDRGIVFRKKGNCLITNHCPQIEHKKHHLCVSVDPEKQIFHCNDCDIGGSVIDFVMIADGLDVKAAMQKLGGEDHQDAIPASTYRPSARPNPEIGSGQRNGGSNDSTGKIVATYDYTDGNGKLIFQVVRYEPKEFRQRRPVKDGWNWSLEGVRRVLYNLPGIKKSDFVWLVEGEKDADALISRGLCATTNAGGAKKWEPQYTETLSGKDVIICGDSDEKGEEHANLVFEAIKNTARSVRRIRLPPILYKDVSEFLEKDSIEALKEIASQAEPLYHGTSIPVQTMVELEEQYRRFSQKVHTTSMDLSKWLPSFQCVRPIVPGEVVAIVCDTGVGKSAAAYSLALKVGLQTLIFQVELPGTLSFERFAAMITRTSGKLVQECYRDGGGVDCKKYNVLSNISVCSESRITTTDIERIIEGAGVKTGQRPSMVIIDYVQLIRGQGKGRYERMTDIAEELKIIAKKCNIILVLTSQVARKEGQEISLHDAKDSGQIENSSGLVLGGWRDEKEPHRKLILKILKNTKGIPGKKITCRIHESLLIEEDVPIKDQQPKFI